MNNALVVGVNAYCMRRFFEVVKINCATRCKCPFYYSNDNNYDNNYALVTAAFAAAPAFICNVKFK